MQAALAQSAAHNGSHRFGMQIELSPGSRRMFAKGTGIVKSERRGVSDRTVLHLPTLNPEVAQRHRKVLAWGKHPCLLVGAIFQSPPLWPKARVLSPLGKGDHRGCGANE